MSLRGMFKPSASLCKLASECNSIPLKRSSKRGLSTAKCKTWKSTGQYSPRRELVWSQSSSTSSRDQVCIQSYPQWHHKYYQRLEESSKWKPCKHCRIKAAFLGSPRGIQREGEDVSILQMPPTAVKSKMIFLKSSKVGGSLSSPPLIIWPQECDADLSCPVTPPLLSPDSLWTSQRDHHGKHLTANSAPASTEI